MPWHTGHTPAAAHVLKSRSSEASDAKVNAAYGAMRVLSVPGVLVIAADLGAAAGEAAPYPAASPAICSLAAWRASAAAPLTSPAAAFPGRAGRYCAGATGSNCRAAGSRRSEAGLPRLRHSPPRPPLWWRRRRMQSMPPWLHRRRRAFGGLPAEHEGDEANGEN